MLRPQNKIHTKIKTVVEQLDQYQPDHSDDLEVTVTGISMQSQSVEPGDLYAAVAGAQHHGADYIGQAVQAGAVAVLTDPSGVARIPDGIPYIVVADVRSALGDAASLLYGNAGARLPRLFGVTGTNGKTTTTYFLESLVAALGERTGLIGTIETRMAGTAVPSAFTTPEAPALHSLIARMREADIQTAAMEVSSHAMAYKRMYGLRYDVVGFTNLTQDHLDLHGSMAEYFDAKARLFEPQHSAIQVITINGGAEPQWGQQLASRVPNAVTLDLGPAAVVRAPVGPATWRISALEPQGLGHAFTLDHLSGFQVHTRVGMPGEFNVANAALAAVMVFAGHHEHEWSRIKAALENSARVPFESAVPGRMEVMSDAPAVIVDFAHNPDGLTQALQAVNRASESRDSGRTILVFGATGQRDTAKRPLMGSIAARYADVVIVTDDDPHHEPPEDIRKAVLAGAQSEALDRDASVEVLEIAPRADALRQAVQMAGLNDTILAAGRGHETHQDLAGVPFAIDDRQVLRQALVDYGFITTSSISTPGAD